MATSRDLALDATYDLSIVGQDLAPLVADNDAIQSDCTATVQLMLGEWFDDLSQGIPWLQQGLGAKKPNLAALRASLASALAARPGVTQVQFVTVALNSARLLNVSWSVLVGATKISGTAAIGP